MLADEHWNNQNNHGIGRGEVMKKGIDVSSYQGTVDWKKVKKAGIKFAILKIIRKDLQPDKQFEKNWKGCESAGVPIQGVYNYTYATTTAKAVKDAKSVVEVLAGRKTMVWLDVEDHCLEGLGKTLIDIINVYADVIKGAGLEFGVYTGQYFYNTYIKPYGGVTYPLWIARYGKNNGEVDEKYKPQIPGMMGWQYSSRGSVDGVSGNVDMNLWYADIVKGKEEPVAKTKTVEQLAAEVLDGVWGNGVDRKANLTAAGYDYEAVQAKVNSIMNSNKAEYYTIKRGDTLSGIAKLFDTTVTAIVKLNNVADKNKIRAGQKIRIR